MTSIFITGTPGTGKTTVSKILSNKLGFSLVAVNDLVEKQHLYNGHHTDKGYKIVDIDALSKEITNLIENTDDVIIEGHLAHMFENDDLVDLVIVMRTRPDILKKRLIKRGWSDSKINENLEAEALDICTFEAFEIHGDKVNEIDTSIMDLETVADCLIQVISGKKNLPPGNLNFLDFLYLNE